MKYLKEKYGTPDLIDATNLRKELATLKMEKGEQLYCL
jgi:hypothetical protein